MKEPISDASPMKSVVEELETLRSDFRASLNSYATRIESEITTIRAAVEKDGKKVKVSSARIRDLRDMLTLLRKFQIKPEKGRRKDLKKLDSLVGDLTLLIESW
jgi:chromosome segregation ATPase